MELLLPKPENGEIRQLNFYGYFAKPSPFIVNFGQKSGWYTGV